MEELQPVPTLMLVDDNEGNLLLLESMLEPVKYHCLKATRGKEALDIIRSRPREIDVVLLDIVMPGMGGLDLAKILQSDDQTKHIPIIFLTGKKRDYDDVAAALDLGAVEYLTKPVNHVELTARINLVYRAKLLREKIEQTNATLEQKVIERTREVELTRDAVIFGFGKLAEYRDKETGQHLERIRIYTKTLAEELQEYEKFKGIIDDNFIRNIYKSSPLHDIGKIGIPDNILLKPDKLTPEEFEIMKKHTTIGGDTIAFTEQDMGSAITFLTMGKVIAYSHHEKFDGTGYPRGLKGYTIPPEGRIMALADFYDALVNTRVYKEAFSHEKAREIIFESSGKHFDPDIVRAFRKLEDLFVEIKDLYANPELTDFLAKVREKLKK